MPLVRSGNGHYFAAGTAPGTIRHGGRDVRPDGAFYERPTAVVHAPVGRVGNALATMNPRDLPDGEYRLPGGFKLNVGAGRAFLSNGSTRVDLTDVNLRPDAPLGTTLAQGTSGAFHWMVQRGVAGHVGGGRFDWVNPNVVLQYTFSSSQPLSTITWSPTPA